MMRVRKYLRTLPGGLLAALVAYSLIIQASIAGVCLAMQSGPSHQPDLILCSGTATTADAIQRDVDHKSGPVGSGCESCFAAAQNNGQITAGEYDAVPLRVVFGEVRALYGTNGDVHSVPHYRRMAGDPRGPPPVSLDA
jgi:hypothetical protein